MNKIKEYIAQYLPFSVAVPAVIWQVMFFWLPLVFLVGLSVSRFDASWQFVALTLQPYSGLFDWIHLLVIGRSLFLAFATALICLIIGYPVAYYIALRAKRFKTILLFFLTLPFWVNFLVHVYAWFFILDYQGIINIFLLKVGFISQPLYLLNSPFAVGLIMVHCYLPFMVLPIYTILEKLDTRLLEASSDLGARAPVILRMITLPLSLSGVRAGFFLIFISAFGEYAIPVLLGGAKKLYVGTLITNYFLFSQEIPAGAAFTVYSSLVLIMAAVILRLLLSRLVILKGVCRPSIHPSFSAKMTGTQGDRGREE